MCVKVLSKLQGAVPLLDIVRAHEFIRTLRFLYSYRLSELAAKGCISFSLENDLGRGTVKR